MAAPYLVPQELNFPFAQGIDTKTDPKQVLPGKLLVLQNATFANPKELRKRNGYDLLSSSLSGGNALSAFKNQLVATDGQSLYSWSGEESAPYNQGACVACDVATQSIYKNSNPITQCDWAYDPSSGLSCYVGSSASNVLIIVQDTATGSIIYQPVLNDTGIQISKVVVFNGSFLILISNGSWSNGPGTLLGFHIPISAPSSITKIGTNLLTNVLGFDCIVSGSKLFYSAAVDFTSSQLNYIDTSFTNHTGTTLSGNYTTPFITTDGSNNLWVAGFIQGSGTNSDVKYEIWSNSLSSVLGLTTLDSTISIADADSGVVTCSVNGTTGTFYYGPTEVITNTSGGISYSDQAGGYINTNTGTSGGTVGSVTTIIRSLILASRPFSFNSEICLVGTYQSALQSSYVLITTSGQILGQLANGNAYFGMGAFINTLPGAGTLAQLQGFPLSLVTPTSTATGNIQFPYLVVDQLTTVGGQVQSQAGINAAIFTLGDPAIHCLGANNLLFSGALPRIYDGVSTVEQGFLKYPENLTQTTATSAGSMGPGTNTSVSYQWVAVYEWMDAQGQINYSAPSQPLTATVGEGSATTHNASLTSGSTKITSAGSGFLLGQVISGTGITSGTYIADVLGGGSYILSQPATTTGTESISTTDTNKVTVVIPTLRLTAKPNVVISLWRTLGNGTTFFKVTSITSPTFNSTTTDTVSIIDSVPDAILSGNEQLYTTGGVIENICLPPVSAVWNYQGRIMAVTEENPLVIWPSQQIQPNVPVEFNDTFPFQLDEQGGGVVAGAQMDDKCIFFKQNGIYFMVGSGPSQNGQNNDFSTPQRIPTNAGVTDPRSVVLTPGGIMFKGVNGIYLLDRSLAVQYVGADVEAYNSYTITSALLIPGTTTVRFTISNGTALVYDFYVGQWSVFTNISAADATIFDGVYTYLNSGGGLYEETPGTYTDNGSPVLIGLTTSWLKFADLQGFQRVWEFYILGEYKSPHTLTVGVAYDFNSTVVQSDPIVVGSSIIPYQYRINPKQERCMAMQVTLTESQSANYGEGLSLSGISFRCGLKRGFNKIPAAQYYG